MVCLLEVGATLKQPWARKRYTGHEHSRLAPWSTVPTACSRAAAQNFWSAPQLTRVTPVDARASQSRGFQLCRARSCCSALAVPWPCCPNARGAAGMRECHICNERACTRIFRAGRAVPPVATVAVSQDVFMGVTHSSGLDPLWQLGCCRLRIS